MNTTIIYLFIPPSNKFEFIIKFDGLMLKSLKKDYLVLLYKTLAFIQFKLHKYS